MQGPGLVHELWEEPDGTTMVCHAGPGGDAARAALHERARLAWIFDARSHFDAMTKYHERMGWAPYTTDQPWDLEPYPVEWAMEQRAALEVEHGNRDVIAASRMANAWREAAADLVIRFESPYVITSAGVDYWFVGRLPDFGGSNGAIVADRRTIDGGLDVAESLGFFAPGLSPYAYEVYDREMFRETLNDWGWFGDPTSAPSWFAGALGRHGGAG